MRLPFDALLCDFDGVIRFYDTGEVAELERGFGVEPGTTARTAFAPDVDGPAMVGEITVPQWVDAMVAALTEQMSPEQARKLGEAFTGAPFSVEQDVLDLLRQAQAHVPVVLVSNATLQLEEDLDALGLTHFFDEVVSSARVGVVKPDRRIYQIAAERAGADPRRCLFIDDRAENVEAAVALGMTGVLFREVADMRRALTPLLTQPTTP
ncbi:HAD family hydrolase [Sphaerimonospora thailandensis]|uniref:Hydrolase n=1 Tax=Sphaerimonospora thailandensis TaxID=795644 RepID=A0A8J3RD48_9ACTN|nr:HAD family phosphatase [Sphaerimonospora thailandensis]GIH72554.1 hydrolase [Sphaerimonospora thailandensis]